MDNGWSTWLYLLRSVLLRDDLPLEYFQVWDQDSHPTEIISFQLSAVYFAHEVDLSNWIDEIQRNLYINQSYGSWMSCFSYPWNPDEFSADATEACCLTSLPWWVPNFTVLNIPQLDNYLNLWLLRQYVLCFKVRGKSRMHSITPRKNIQDVYLSSLLLCAPQRTILRTRALL